MSKANSMNFTVKRSRIIRDWPRIELYQNSTLRYTPPANFPAHWVSQNGRPSIIRTWVTLDEIYDVETDTYDWNYQIGVDKLGDKRYYPYDWPKTRPSNTHFEDYLTSFCSMADEALFNIRRFERETADGIMSYEKYEEIVENVIEHCKKLCSNIVYIEVSNECEIKSFGKMTVREYMPLYDAVCRAVARLNAKYGWELKVGGTAMTDHGALDGMWLEYLKALSEDTCPEKRIDFYSMHAYDEDVNILQQLYNMHRFGLKKYGLPDAPFFFNEYGTLGCSPETLDSLRNASGTLVGMMRSADLENFYIFPWCTFHNPVLQMSYTQYVGTDDGRYMPTPNGLAVHMLWGMLKEELQIAGDTDFRARCTADGNKLYFIISNPDDEPLEVHFKVTELEGSSAKISVCQVDEEHNNAVMAPPCMELSLTKAWNAGISDGELQVDYQLPRYGFACITIEVA